MSLLCPTNALCGALVTVSHLQTHTVKKNNTLLSKVKIRNISEISPLTKWPHSCCEVLSLFFKIRIPSSRGPHRTVILFIQMQLFQVSRI